MSATKAVATHEPAKQKATSAAEAAFPDQAAPPAETPPGAGREAAGQEPELVYLDPATLRPDPVNPRQKLTGIAELAASIRGVGLLIPLVVYPDGKGGPSSERDTDAKRRWCVWASRRLPVCAAPAGRPHCGWPRRSWRTRSASTPALPRRQQTDQPRPPHHGPRPTPQPDRRTRLLRPQEGRRQALMEAMRCVKRRLSDIVYQQMLNDALATTPRTGPRGHRGNGSDSCATSSHPHAGSSEKSLPGPANNKTRTRLPSAS
jgi:ParB-like nuclease domain